MFGFIFVGVNWGGMADIVFLVDDSSRISDWNAVRQFIASVVGKMSISQTSLRLGLVRYDSVANVEFYLTDFSSASDIQFRVLSMVMNGGNRANLAVGLQAAQSIFQASFRNNAKRIIVTITGGKSDDYASTLAQAYVTKWGSTSVTKVLSLSIGLSTDSDGYRELLQVATNPGEVALFSVLYYSSLSSQVDTLLYEISTPSPMANYTFENSKFFEALE